MTNTRPKELAASITFRLTPAEKEALAKLAASRAAQAEAQDFPAIEVM
jgi:hypothetical protein